VYEALSEEEEMFIEMNAGRKAAKSPQDINSANA
jgi:hypothetical protein